MALVVAVIAVLGYFGNSAFNPITQEKQHVAGITPEQEVALGLQAAPEMVQQFGGLDPDPEAQQRVSQIGERLVSRTAAAQSPYQFEFHLLDDPETINAFALPGGQVFITEGLLKRLETDGQLAGVLGHEIGHVVGRHGAEHIAKQQLTEGLTGAAVLATYDPNNPSTQNSAAVAAMIGQLVGMRFGRQDELESDELGVRFTSRGRLRSALDDRPDEDPGRELAGRQAAGVLQHPSESGEPDPAHRGGSQGTLSRRSAGRAWRSSREPYRRKPMTRDSRLVDSNFSCSWNCCGTPTCTTPNPKAGLTCWWRVRHRVGRCHRAGPAGHARRASSTTSRGAGSFPAWLTATFT